MSADCGRYGFHRRCAQGFRRSGGFLIKRGKGHLVQDVTRAVRAIDGTTATIDIVDVNPEDVLGWSGHARYIPNYGSRAQTGELWAVEIASAALLELGAESVEGRPFERFAAGGGEIHIYDCGSPQGARWAAWVGPWHMAHGMFYAPQYESKDVADYFARLSFVDTPEGLTADPGKRFKLESMRYNLPVIGVGALAVEPRTMAPGAVPAWRGVEMAGGEVWKLAKAPAGEGDNPLLLVTDSAVVTLTPWDVPNMKAPEEQDLAPSAASFGSGANALGFLSKVSRVVWEA